MTPQEEPHSNYETQEDKLSKATRFLFTIKIIAKLEVA